MLLTAFSLISFSLPLPWWLSSGHFSVTSLPWTPAQFPVYLEWCISCIISHLVSLSLTWFTLWQSSCNHPNLPTHSLVRRGSVILSTISSCLLPCHLSKCGPNAHQSITQPLALVTHQRHHLIPCFFLSFHYEAPSSSFTNFNSTRVLHTFMTQFNT